MEVKFTPVEQNSKAWEQLRAGRVTASKMGVVMANYGKAFSETAKKYAVNVAIERITGKPIASNYSNAHMDRGHEQEPIARALYEDKADCFVANGGFFYTDTLGCSPDGLVYDEGEIEIKSVIAPVHYANLKRGDIDPTYKWQMWINLKMSGRKWLDFVSYSAEFPVDKQLFIHRIYPGGLVKEFAMIDERIELFEKLVISTKETILDGDYSTEAKDSEPARKYR